MKSIAVLGSTGSIGSQTLDIIAAHPEDFRVVALAAGKNNPALLAEQINLFDPQMVSVPDADTARQLRDLLASKGTIGKSPEKSRIRSLPEIVLGNEGLEAVAAHADAEMIVSGVVGFLGVLPTAAAIRCGKTIALANKETLVAAGCAIMPMARQYGATIVPVDSEHSAIHQSLSGYTNADIKQILLTGSGGPFRTWSKEEIGRATVDDALKHPNWSMGQKITIDSATLMNKGLEIIEARWLFDVPAELIRVVIHPQSILHSAVEFTDGSVIGQMGMPDMHLPIHYALYWPERHAARHVPPLDLVKVGALTFEEPDYERFPCLALARAAASRDDTVPCVLNAANEVAVEAVLRRQIRFAEIAQYIEKVLDLHQAVSKPSLNDILEADRWARQAVSEFLGALAK